MARLLPLWAMMMAVPPAAAQVVVAPLPGFESPAAQALRSQPGAIVPPTAAERLAAARGLAPDDVRVQFDLRPTAVTFWVGAAAKDGILRNIATQPWNADWGGDTVGAMSISHRLGRYRTSIAVDAEGGAGYRSGDSNSPEVWGAIYFRYDGFPWRERVYTTFGLSTGLTYMQYLPEVETGTRSRPEPNTSHLLHYFSPEISIAHPRAPEHELALRYSHRSGIFGTFNGVWEGSNVLMLGYRRRL
jgi:hypothetical protein